ncbi:RING/U-box superfamily protein [Euphorbia peplus]|nr:RING/U-box superfamily protein [Euphorbia peplus]
MVDKPCNINVRGLVLHLDLVHVHRFDREETDDQVVKLDGVNVGEENVEDLRSMSSECRICLDTLSIGERVIRLPCNHVFHADCLITWLQTSQFCPLCSFSLF